jgi:tetratricopeptide (TPR) repeat protein
MAPGGIIDAETAGRAFKAFIGNATGARARGDKQAETLWREAAGALHSLDPAAIDDTAQALLNTGQAAEALDLATLVAALDPTSARALYRVGYVLQCQNRHGEAIPHYDAALAMDADFPGLRNRLAASLILTDQDRERAFHLLQAAVAANPGDADAWINLTDMYRSRKDLAASLAAGERAIELAPDHPMAFNNYTLALKEAQRWDEADRTARRALALAPSAPSYQFNLGILNLLHGRYEEGWRDHEVRWEGSGELRGRRPVLPGPAWRGEPLEGKTLLLWGEQGIGDVMQFCRYAPLLADYVNARGGRLVWNCFPQMGGLVWRSLSDGVAEYSNGGIGSLPPFDYEIALLSLPLLFGTRAETIPWTGPYLKADPAAAKGWRAKLARNDRLKVGLAWTGSATHQRNPYRSVGLARYIEHLGPIAGATFFSLQPDAKDEVAKARAEGFDIADHTSAFQTVDDTAAFVDALDMVITVCTSMAHLSGAMGKPTFVLLDTNPHWVWGAKEPTSAWYPTARLYRQPSFNQWTPVLEKVAQDLKALANKAGDKASEKKAPQGSAKTKAAKRPAKATSKV